MIFGPRTKAKKRTMEGTKGLSMENIAPEGHVYSAESVDMEVGSGSR